MVKRRAYGESGSCDSTNWNKLSAEQKTTNTLNNAARYYCVRTKACVHTIRNARCECVCPNQQKNLIWFEVIWYVSKCAYNVQHIGEVGPCVCVCVCMRSFKAVKHNKNVDIQFAMDNFNQIQIW